MQSLTPSQYNEFLFALVGEQDNETPLSVLSALTRLDIDPWKEAARLSQLPKGRAVQEIASVLGALPAGRWAAAERSEIAARLVEFLPCKNASPATERIGAQLFLLVVLMFAIFGVVFGTILIEDRRAAASHQASAQAANVIPWQPPSSRSDAAFRSLTFSIPGTR